MIITVSVVLGFKNTIRDKVVGFGSHIQIENFATQQMGIPAPVCISDSLLRQLKAVPGVSHVSRYTQVHGILKTDSDFLGVALKGIDKSADLTFYDRI